MQLAFGDRFDYDRAGLLIVTAAMGLYLAATTLNQAALAQGQARRAADLLGRLRGRLSRLEPARRCSTTRRAGSRSASRPRRRCSACCCWRVYRDPRPASTRTCPAPGSPEETEARLALADEAS